MKILINSYLILILAKLFSSSLDIGCGQKIKNPFLADQICGVDLIDFDNVVKCDVIANKLPFEDNQFDCCTAFDFLEHVPRVSIKNGKTCFLLLN